MRRFRYALWPAGLAFGAAAEWAGRPELIALDAAAGFALVFLGLVAWARRPGSRTGPIMTAAGFAWFLGTLWAPAVFWHRGPLAQLLVAYPSGRLSSRLLRVGVGAAYAYAVAAVVAGSNYLTIVFALGLTAVAARRYLTAAGPERRARLASLTAAAAFGLVLVADAILRLAGVGTSPVLLAWYDLTICLIAVGLTADLWWGAWARGAVTGLVVDLGEAAAGGVLRDRLARALGDPTLVVGYWLPGQRRYVDEAGRPVRLPGAGAGRAVTPVEENGQRVAVLIHDLAVLDESVLLSAVEAAARLAVCAARHDGRLVVEVEGDSAPAEIIGLQDRVGALDGSVTVVPGPGGRATIGSLLDQGG